MPDEPKSQGWWLTLPGLLTATAGIITAVAGLIAALHQAGVFTTAPRPVQQPPSSTTTAVPPASPPAGVATGASSTAPPPPGPATPYPRALAAGTEVRERSGVYRILAAQVDRRNTDTLTLRFTVRMANDARFRPTSGASPFACASMDSRKRRSAI
jgi:hypothetical protein